MTSKKLSRTQGKLINLIFLILYLISLGFGVKAARNYVGYEGFGFTVPGMAQIFLAMIAISLLLPILPIQFDTLSALIIWFFTLTLLMPMLALYVFNSDNFASVKLQLLTALFLSIYVFCFLLIRMKPINAPDGSRLESMVVRSESKIPFAIIGISILSIAILFFAFHFSGIDISLATLNNRRMTNRYSVGPFPGSAYVYAWIAALLIPLNILSWVVFKKLLFLGLGTIIAIMVFSISGSKSDILSPLLAIAIFFVYNSRRKYIPILLHHSVYFVIAVAPVTLALVANSPLLFLSTTRRMLFIPARLSIEYFNYVSENGVTFFKQNRLGFLFSGEQIPLSMIIGGRVSSGSNTNANINAFIDGYASLGIFGMLLIAILLGMTVRGIENSLNHIASRELFVPLSFTACTVWLNQAYFTSLLSSGVFLFLLIPYLNITINKSRRSFKMMIESP